MMISSLFFIYKADEFFSFGLVFFLFENISEISEADFAIFVHIEAFIEDFDIALVDFAIAKNMEDLFES